MQRINAVFSHLVKNGGVTTPAGNQLTTQSLQSLGIRFGGAQGFEHIHYLFENAFDRTGSLSYSFLKGFDNAISFDTNVLYALLHESIYCQGAASNWSAESALMDLTCVNFRPNEAVESGKPVYFTGEMVFPWMFEQFAQLRPLREVAELLSVHEDWPPLYDDNQLMKTEVPVAAAAYFEDMYVDIDLSMQTAAKIAGIRLFVTNEYLHSGIREDGPRILQKLLNMARDVETLR